MEANKIATFSKTEEIRGAVFTEILCLHLSISAFSIFIVHRMILTPTPHSPPLLPLTVYFMKALLCGYSCQNSVLTPSPLFSLADQVISPQPMF